LRNIVNGDGASLIANPGFFDALAEVVIWAAKLHAKRARNGASGQAQLGLL
jgi:hypothetical protein